ncbi:C-type lectin domain family 4 member M-like [Salmo salar]|uniref:C-type lectin domain family 4 member M-like n=1 Tax=Salmo salar TaxID=8030 RepID=A0ABM3EMR5_SALSA|nr:C-type lectin domain family 4 member M-like [Salmo salar]XP_045572356.1 C-type lectin domain family 4 member M-like [Salmo salar]
MANYVNKQVIELNEVTEENQNRATRSMKSETQLSDERTRLYRLAAVCFGVLCVLQVILNISLRLAFSGSNKERNQLEACYNTTGLAQERDQPDTSSGIIDLCTDRDQLQRERDQCRKNMNQLERERGQLLRDRDQSENTEDKKQLQERYNALTKDRDLLRNKVSVLTNEKVALEKRISERGINICLKIGKPCPEGWRLLGSSCYFLSTQMKTWEESRLDCLNRGAYLVIINSLEEQQFLLDVNKRGWIGLTDSVTEGTWKWVDDTPLTTPSYWYSPQPDNGGDNPANGEEDCVELNTETWHPVKAWNDQSCEDNRYWICEKSV